MADWRQLRSCLTPSDRSFRLCENSHLGAAQALGFGVLVSEPGFDGLAAVDGGQMDNFQKTGGCAGREP